MTTPAYDFDEETQKAIVSCMMWDGDFDKTTEGLVKASYFENTVVAGFAQLSLEYYAKYKTAPDKTAWVEIIKDGFKRKPALWRDDQKKEVIEFYQESTKITVKSRKFLMDIVEEFAKQQEVIAGLIDAAQLAQKVGDASRFKKIEKRLKTAFEVSLHEEDDDYDYAANIEVRTKARVDKAAAIAGGTSATGIPSGIKELDEIMYHGGWGRKELSLFMGGAKAGKSFALATCAANALRQGYNVLVVTLEVSKEIYADRIDANISGIGMSKHLSSPHGVKAGIETFVKSHVKGTMRIRERPSGTFRPSDLRKMIDDYKTKGIVFDLVVIDYLDIMKPNYVTDSPIENSKSIFLDARAIAQEEGFALLSATQTNRDGVKAAVAKSTDVAEDFNKIRIADIVVSINRTDEEKASNEARLYIAANRNGKDGITIFTEQDLDCANSSTRVTGVE